MRCKMLNGEGAPWRLGLWLMLICLVAGSARAEGLASSNMSSVGYFPIPTVLSDLEVSGNRAYVLTAGNNQSGQHISILDVSNPSKPAFLGKYYTPKYTQFNDIAVFGETVYAATQYGLEVIDVRNGQSPRQVGGLLNGDVRQIEISDTWLAARLMVNETAYSPTQMPYPVTREKLSFVNLQQAGGKPIALYAQDYAYLASAGQGRFVTTGPKGLVFFKPNTSGQYESWTIKRVANFDVPVGGSGNRLYGFSYRQLGMHGGLMNMLDLTAASAPKVYPYMMPGRGVDLALSGSMVYVADEEQGVHVYDTRNPNDPTPLRGSFYTRMPAVAVRAAGPLVYVLSQEYGLQILRLTGAAAAIRVDLAGGNTQWKRGGWGNVEWATENKVAGTAVRLELWRGGQKVTDLGSAWTSNNNPNQKSLRVPPNVAPGNDYTIRAISTWDPTYWAETAGFVIE